MSSGVATSPKHPGRTSAWRTRVTSLFKRAEHIAVGIESLGGGEYAVASLVLHDGKAAAIRCTLRLPSEDKSRKDWADSLGLTPGAPVVLALPRNEVIIRTIRVPSSDLQQIAQMVPFEAASHLPWPPEESEIGYEVQGTDSDGYTTVLLFIARKQSIEEHLERLREYGIRPTRVEVSVFSAARLLRCAGDNERPAVLITGKEGLTFVRLSSGCHAFSRGVAGGEAPVQMLRQTMELDVRRNGARGSFTSLILVGGSDQDQGALSTLCGTSTPIIRAETARFTALNGAGSLQPSDFVCVGAALGVHGQPSANLLPSREARALVLRQILRQGRSLALLIVWLAAILFTMGYYAFARETHRAEKAEQAIAAIEQDVGDLRSKGEALKLLANERRRVGAPLRIVLELYERTPQAVGIGSMQYDARGSLVLRGESSSFPVVLQYFDTLSRSSLFRKANLDYVTRPQSTSGQGTVEFKVTCELRGSP